MSRTTKLTLVAVVAATSLSLPAKAQEASTSRSEILAAIMGQMHQDEPSAATDIRGNIVSRINEIMSDMGSRKTLVPAEPITIEEIDQINRSADLERTELEFEKTRVERMQLELDRMLILYEAMKTIEEDADKAAAARSESTAAALAASAAPAPDPSVGEAEQLPTVSSITGVGGVYSAQVAFEGQTSQTIRIGDLLDHDFTVEDIRSTHVLLKGPNSEKTYRLTPRAADGVDEGGAMAGGDIIDLSDYPMAQF